MANPTTSMMVNSRSTAPLPESVLSMLAKAYFFIAKDTQSIDSRSVLASIGTFPALVWGKEAWKTMLTQERAAKAKQMKEGDFKEHKVVEHYGQEGVTRLLDAIQQLKDVGELDLAEILGWSQQKGLEVFESKQ